MAFSKEKKSNLQAQYQDLLKNSQAVFVIGYNGMTMKDIDALRAKLREIGGELHVVKNTLAMRALKEAGMPETDYFVGTSLMGFAFNDPPAIAKILDEAVSKAEIFTVKGGYLGTEVLNAKQVKALASLPPLPVMRARLLGLLQTPATQLVRTLAEPGRRVAFVIKAHSEQQPAPEAA
ncbi:MAG TPA: 50S ribosomal protein L10 [Longilinea sp.]|nr:50S ribosomal protein L10 [Longilinea sp.]